MAFTAGSINGGGPRRRFRGVSPMAEMNVIPLVDVVLVLLVIFMLTAHVMEFGLEIEVPRVRQVRNTSEELPVVSITRSGEVYLNENPVKLATLGEAVAERFGAGVAVYVRADRLTTYDPIAQVISALSEAKMEVRLVTQPEEDTRQGR
ncbi:MAG: biopolymer transporter ExbD [Bryobacteraceae bacterium]|nr:biopolymer transporter ExbD [Bryobacteraceae bacterium]